MDDNTDMDRIVVGVDGSASSIAALRYGARMAAAFDAPLEAVTAWTYPAFADPAVVNDWSPERDAAMILDDAIETAFAGDPPEGITRRALAGSPARLLIEMSKSCGMLVLGSRGRGGFVGLLLGSVSATCAEHAHCPVVVVHGRGGGELADAPADTRAG
jgi:nucleotide-binding universal stress UspA family protein